jgi:hypothetical protein
MTNDFLGKRGQDKFEKKKKKKKREKKGKNIKSNSIGNLRGSRQKKE